MPTMTVKNSTGEGIRMVDRYVTDPELELSYEGFLSWWIPHGETRVIDYTGFVMESLQHWRPQIISVVVAGGGPEEILRHSDFSDGGSFEFTMVTDVEGGQRRLVHHTFDAGNVVDAGNGNGVVDTGNGNGNGVVDAGNGNGVDAGNGADAGNGNGNGANAENGGGEMTGFREIWNNMSSAFVELIKVSSWE